MIAGQMPHTLTTLMVTMMTTGMGTMATGRALPVASGARVIRTAAKRNTASGVRPRCLLYTPDAAVGLLWVDLGAVRSTQNTLPPIHTVFPPTNDGILKEDT